MKKETEIILDDSEIIPMTTAFNILFNVFIKKH